jgi:glycosyltransferase involved in cell wall biosynthesis
MRILLITGEYPPESGGVGDYTRRLAQALSERGHDLQVLTDTTAAQTSGREDGVQVVRRARGWGWGVLRTIRQVVAELNPAIIHIQYQTGAYTMHPAITMVPRERRRQGTTIVVTCHDLRVPYLFPRAGLLRHGVTRLMLDSCDAVIVTNAEDRLRLAGQGQRDPDQYLATTPPRAQIEQIPIGSNIAPAPPAGFSRAAMRQRLGVAAEDAPLVAYFGLLSRSKGLDLLLEALAQLPERFRLLLIGGAAPGPEDQRFAQQLDRQIAQAGLGQRVLRTGPLAPEDVSAHLLAADMAALPFRDGASYRRGSLLAALAHGLPTVTTTPQRELDPPLDGAALLVAPGDSGALGAALSSLAHSPELRRQLGEGATALAAQFDWDAIAQRHELLYRRLLAEQARRENDSS